MKTYDKIFVLGHEENQSLFENDDDIIEISEKVDGANFRFEIVNNKLFFASRNQPLVEGQINKNFRRAVEYVTSKFESLPIEKRSEFEGKVFFCENMIKHTIGYNWDITPPAIGYDVFDVVNGKYVENAKEVFDRLGIEFVPVVWKGKVKDLHIFLESCKK